MLMSTDLAEAVNPTTDTLRRVARVYVEQRRFDDARDALRRILVAEPANAGAWLDLALLHESAGHARPALRLLRRPARLDPRRRDVLWTMATLAQQLGSYPDMLEAYEGLVAAGVDDNSVHWNIAVLLFKTHQHVRALEAHREYSRRAPHDERSWWNFAAIANVMGDAEGVAFGFKRFLEISPGDAEAWSSLGRLEANGKAHDRALACFRRGAVLTPDRAVAWGDLAASLLALGRFEETAQALRRALALSPDRAEWYGAYGHCLVETGKPLLARSAHARAHRLRPDEKSFRRRYGQVLSDLRQDAEAAAVILPGIEAKTGAPWPIQTAYELLIRQNRIADAHSFLLAQFEAGAPRDLCATGFADIAAHQGRTDQALDLLEPFIARTNWSRTFVLYHVLRLRKDLARKNVGIERRKRGSGPSIAMSSLAHYGRFAHQTLEYIFCRLYARKHDLDFETPDWVGHYLFELDDPLYDGRFVVLREQNRFLREAICGMKEEPRFNVDFFSPGSLERFESRFRPFVQGLLKPRDVWRPHLNAACAAVRARGETVVALHVRLGDLAHLQYPTEWYRRWLRSIWGELARPVLFIASDDLERAKAEFADFNPVSIEDIDLGWTSATFFVDFHILSQADVLVTSIGTFGLLAALLNSRAKTFARPNPDAGRVEPFQPWSD